MPEQASENIILSASEGARLRASLTLGGVESVRGISDMSQVLNTSLNNLIDSEVKDEATIDIPIEHASSMRQLVSFALKQEFLYVEGMCDTGMIDAALLRLGSDHGPLTLIGVFKKIAAAEQSAGPVPMDKGVKKMSLHWD